jgi:hypothetical protein
MPIISTFASGAARAYMTSGGAIKLLGTNTWDATGIGAVTSIDVLAPELVIAAVPDFGYLKYIISKSTGAQTITVAYRKSGSVFSQSAFSTLGQAAGYVGNTFNIYNYGNDDHDTLFMDSNGRGVIARTNVNTFQSSWDTFRGASNIIEGAGSIDGVTQYPPSAFIGGSPATVVSFPKTESQVWVKLDTNQYKVNGLTAQTWDGTSSGVIGTGGPTNSLYTISDGVNQFVIGRWGSQNARLCTVNLSSGVITSTAITWSAAPSQANQTEEDAVGTQLFTVDGTMTFHSGGVFYSGGTRPWKNQNDSPVSTAGKATFSAGSNTQTDMDVFGSIDGTDRYMWIADWGHDDGGLFGVGNDSTLGTRKTNIIHLDDTYVN